MQGLGSSVWGSGVQGLGVQGFRGSGVQGFRGSGFRGSGFRGSGFRVQEFRSSGVLVEGLGSTLGLSTALELVSACDRDFLHADVYEAISVIPELLLVMWTPPNVARQRQ